jgi:hypothetical protein
MYGLPETGVYLGGNILKGSENDPVPQKGLKYIKKI